MSMRDSFVIKITGDCATGLHKEPVTADEAFRRQEVEISAKGNFHCLDPARPRDGSGTKLHVCRYDAVRRDYVCNNCFKPLVLDAA